ncbi:hypothetical protein EJD97_007763 [Solanum chilense]|uniref:FBD domain-containing protein n=1 Tax=Solanum chilense TaxID=4083 RepID=A0A6N2AL23_SOLCI|nr:hypothetical protein EJD97_007763 [Solanum chilense]
MPPDEQRLSLPSPDWFSNLNIHLIDDIQSRLSFRDVVRVNTLSKDSQYICWRIPHVKFDQTVWKTPEDLTSPTIGFIPILDSFLRSLICKCPLLEDLVLKDIDNPYLMSINAPKLRELVLEDKDDFVSIFPLFLLSSVSAGMFLRGVSLLMEIISNLCPRRLLMRFLQAFWNHLRTVKFYDVLLEEGEKLVKVLLAKSPALLKIVIKPRQMETNNSLKVLKEITKFQRASSKAEVVYLVD